jgi:hypothetical protein
LAAVSAGDGPGEGKSNNQQQQQQQPQKEEAIKKNMHPCIHQLHCRVEESWTFFCGRRNTPAWKRQNALGPSAAHCLHQIARKDI